MFYGLRPMIAALVLFVLLQAKSGLDAVPSVGRWPALPHHRARHTNHRMLAPTYDGGTPCLDLARAPVGNGRLLCTRGLCRHQGRERGGKACGLRDEAAKQADARRSRANAMVTGRRHGLPDLNLTRQPG